METRLSQATAGVANTEVLMTQIQNMERTIKELAEKVDDQKETLDQAVENFVHIEEVEGQQATSEPAEVTTGSASLGGGGNGSNWTWPPAPKFPSGSGAPVPGLPLGSVPCLQQSGTYGRPRPPPPIRPRISIYVADADEENSAETRKMLQQISALQAFDIRRSTSLE